jgi:hypothetical protein
VASGTADEALRWYAEGCGMRVFTDVPLTRPEWKGWGPDCWERIAAVAVPSEGNGVVARFAEEELVDELSGDAPVQPIIVSGGAGRYVYGHLATQEAFLKRTWTPNGPVGPVVLVPPGRDHSNCASAYDAAGFEILAVAGEAPSRRRGGGGWRTWKDPWEHPKGPEDRWLHGLWLRRGHKGWWLAEVPIGKRAPRRYDAVVVQSERPRHSEAKADLEEFRAVVAGGADVELVEAKRTLNEEVVGQLLGGVPTFSEEYPGHGELTLTACVNEPGDEAMAWFCEQSGIRVEVVP